MVWGEQQVQQQAATAVGGSLQEIMSEQSRRREDEEVAAEQDALERAIRLSLELEAEEKARAAAAAAAAECADDAELARQLQAQFEAEREGLPAPSEAQPAAAAAEKEAADEETQEALSDLALAMQLQEEEDARLREFETAERAHRVGKVQLRSRFEQPWAQPAQAVPQRLGADDAEAAFAEAQSIREALREPASKSGDKLPPWPRRNKNLKGQGGDDEIITKHDPEISGRRNWSQLGDTLGEKTRTGDMVSESRKISNRVFNSLKHKIKKQEGVVKGLSATVERDTIQTHAKGLDQKTRLILHKMVNAGLLDEVHGVVRTGKEAVVYHASGHFENTSAGAADDALELTDAESLNASGGEWLNAAAGSEGEELDADEQQEEDAGAAGAAAALESSRWEAPYQVSDEQIQLSSFAVKVFKTTLTEFKRRLDYVRGDHRFKNIQSLSHQNPRKVIQVWADKEMRNLIRARRAGIPCPFPVRLYGNVLVMEFIGEGDWPAPQLKEAKPSPKRLAKCYLQVVFIMQALAKLCGLVHGDLSEYNVLYLKGKCVVIDMGQSVLLNHPKARDFLLADCRNVTRFFASRGVGGLVEPEALADLILDSVALTAAHEEEAAAAAAESQVSGEDEPLEAAYARELGTFADARFARAFAQARPTLP